MSEELKPCPFCGKEACYTDTIGIGIDDDTFGRCSCADTQCLDKKTIFKTKKWNTRPIEDALCARAESAERVISNAQNAYDALVRYREMNTLNFQLEKLDNYLQELGKTLKEKAVRNE